MREYVCRILRKSIRLCEQREVDRKWVSYAVEYTIRFGKSIRSMRMKRQLQKQTSIVFTKLHLFINAIRMFYRFSLPRTISCGCSQESRRWSSFIVYSISHSSKYLTVRPNKLLLFESNLAIGHASLDTCRYRKTCNKNTFHQMISKAMQYIWCVTHTLVDCWSKMIK